MSASTEKRARRDIRRAMGPQALELIDKQADLISIHETRLALIQLGVTSLTADIDLLKAQLVAAGFGTTATQAETATRELHMRIRQLQIKYDRVWDALDEVRTWQKSRLWKRLAWMWRS